MDDFDAYLLACAGAWLALQAVALWKLWGRWRTAAWLSVAAMGLATAVGILGGLAGSNIAPIWIFFALPVCLMWVAALWVLRGLVWAIRR